MYIKKCPNCGKTFETDKHQQKHCCVGCRREYTYKNTHKKNNLKTIICAFCGEAFNTLRKRKYCCKTCTQRAQGKSAAKRSHKILPLSLEAIAKVCRDEGLSYGQYVAKYNL